MGLKTVDLELDLQGQIGPEPKKFVKFFLNAKTFEHNEYYLQTWSVY